MQVQLLLPPPLYHKQKYNIKIYKILYILYIDFYIVLCYNVCITIKYGRVAELVYAIDLLVHYISIMEIYYLLLYRYK